MTGSDPGRVDANTRAVALPPTRGNSNVWTGVNPAGAAIFARRWINLNPAVGISRGEFGEPSVLVEVVVPAEIALEGLLDFQLRRSSRQPALESFVCLSEIRPRALRENYAEALRDHRSPTFAMNCSAL